MLIKAILPHFEESSYYFDMTPGELHIVID